MHDIGEGTIRKIDWQELTPVVLLLRIFNLAFNFRLLTFAAAGLLLSGALLYYCCSETFIRNTTTAPAIYKQHFDYFVQKPFGEQLQQSVFLPGLFYYQTFAPFPEHTPPHPAEAYLWLIGNIVIWLPVTALIMRSAAVRLTVDESEKISNLFLFLRQRILSIVNAVFLLSAGILCCMLPVKIAGWLCTVPVIKYLVAVCLPVPLLFAFFAVILIFGLMFGFPLLIAAVCTDGSDGYDAISRTFSYVFQRPLHYVFYWTYCAVLGYIGYLVMLLLCRLTFRMTVMLCGEMQFAAAGQFWFNVLTVLPAAYLFVWFWTSAAAIYLLLRRSVDACPFSEVYRVKEVKTVPLKELQIKEHQERDIK